jgi:hypothetical protein
MWVQLEIYITINCFTQLTITHALLYQIGLEIVASQYNSLLHFCDCEGIHVSGQVAGYALPLLLMK